MRHGVSLLASLEGMSRATYRIAKELSNNSRSGLTVRFLSKKLEMPEEEIEYLLDVNPRLLFTDLTKVKLVPEGYGAIKRIDAGLENHGDVASVFRLAKNISAHDFRRIEEQIGIEQPTTKKTAVEELLERHYRHPESVVTYVATRGFSDAAREVFDLLWQSKNGVLPVSQLRIAYGGNEFDAEQALWELFRGFACFELFRFDSEDRLVRMAALLSEIRHVQEHASRVSKRKSKLKAFRGKTGVSQSNGAALADLVCQLVAALAARPARLRGDGELFREDRRRLAEICGEEDDPSLNTCLWIAEGVGWLVRVDNTLRAGDAEALLKLSRVERLRLLAQWLFERGDNVDAWRLLSALLEEMEVDKWYPVIDFVHYSVSRSMEHEQPLLKRMGAHWEYVSPSTSGKTESRLARALEESFFWIGIVDRAEAGGEHVFRVSPLGAALLRGEELDQFQDEFPLGPGEFTVQPNFDIVVPSQDMDPLLTVPLDQFARRISVGKATVYHLDKDSFTQAVQEGHDPVAFIEFLVYHNRGEGLPSNVMYTLDDWRGGMKRVRLRTLHVIESEDPLVMADLLHRRRLTKNLTPIDPGKTVRFSGISRAELAKALEKDGFVVE